MPSDPSDFFPLYVHYQERFSAVGRTRYNTFCSTFLFIFLIWYHNMTSRILFSVEVILNAREEQKIMRYSVLLQYRWTFFVGVFLLICIFFLKLWQWLTSFSCFDPGFDLSINGQAIATYNAKGILPWDANFILGKWNSVISCTLFFDIRFGLCTWILDSGPNFGLTNNLWQVFSYDGQHSPDCLAVTAAGIAVYVNKVHLLKYLN